MKKPTALESVRIGNEAVLGFASKIREGKLIHPGSEGDKALKEFATALETWVASIQLLATELDRLAKMDVENFLKWRNLCS